MISSFPRKFLLFIVSSFLTLQLSAQVSKTTFNGITVDEGDLPIPGATVMVLDAKDSTLVIFGSSNTQGAFTLKNVAAGDYLLNITFLGMEPVYQPITAGQVAETDLGKITLSAANTILNEVEVKADHVPIEIH